MGLTILRKRRSFNPDLSNSLDTQTMRIQQFGYATE